VGKKILCQVPKHLSLVRTSRHHYLAARPAERLAPLPCAQAEMLINLLPDFFAVLNSTDRVAAYLRYFDTHRRLL